MKGSKKREEYTPRFGDGLIVVVARLSAVDVVVGGIGVRLLLHVRGA